MGTTIIHHRHSNLGLCAARVVVIGQTIGIKDICIGDWSTDS